MIPNLNLVTLIQEQSEGRQGYLGTLSRPGKEYKEYPMGGLEHQPHGHDLFFTPLKFNGPRTNENAGRANVLFADLDGAGYPDIEPTIWWETSKGNSQAVWFLHAGTGSGVALWRDVNQRLTRATGADPGGWMQSKLLRVPGTVNWKRQEFAGEVVHNRGVSYDLAWLNEDLPLIQRVREAQAMMESHPACPSVSERPFLQRTFWLQMTLRGRSMLTQKSVPDRSLHIVRTAHELRKTLSAEVVFNLLWVAPYNKWRTDRHMPEQLWSEIVRIDN